MTRVLLGSLCCAIVLLAFPLIAAGQEVWQEVQDQHGVHYEKSNGDHVVYAVQGRGATREEYIAEGERIAAQHAAFIQQTTASMTEFEMRPGITEEDARLEKKAAEDTEQVVAQAVVDIHADQARQKAEIMVVKVVPAKALVSLETKVASGTTKVE